MISFYIFAGPETRKQMLLLKPHFTYHGFRYAEVTGFPRKLNSDEIFGIRIGMRGMHNEIETNDKIVTTLFRNIRNSQLSNLMSVPTGKYF